MKCTKYETCSKLHWFHILYISGGYVSLCKLDTKIPFANNADPYQWSQYMFLGSGDT